MPAGPRSEYGIRLERILVEMGYVRDDKVDLDRACAVINRRTLRPLTLETFTKLCKGSKVWTLDLARQVSYGIGFDLRELAYDEPPPAIRRPKNLMDELDLFIGRID